MLSLEDQVDSLKADLTEVRRSQSLTSVSSDSLAAFDQSEIKSQAADGPELYHDPRYSFSYVYKRNKTRDWVPNPSVENIAEDETNQGTNIQRDSAARSTFKSPERLCYHSCSIAASKGKPVDHNIDVHATNGVSGIGSSEDTAACNGETVSERGDQLSSDTDVLNDTLSDLVESNSDSGQVFDVKVSTTVRCKNHVEALKSDALNQSNGSANASEAWKLTKTSSSSATQTDTTGYCNDCAAQTEHDSDRYVITNHFSCRYCCQFCGFYT